MSQRSNRSKARPDNKQSRGKSSFPNSRSDPKGRSTRDVDRSRNRNWNKKDRDADSCSSNSRGSGRTDSPGMSGLNDYSWYSKYPSLLNAAAAFPYPYRPGMTLPMGDIRGAYTNASTVQYTDVRMRIPGVLQINWSPSVGQSTQPTDPASIVGKEVYAAVRKVFSGSIDADAPDFVMYLLALDSLFSYIGALKRVYRCLTAWSPDNFQTPDVLLSSLGVSTGSAKTLRANEADFLRMINELVLQSRKFRCPAIMDLFNRHYWLNDNVYTDAPTINSQFYVFNQQFFLQLKSDAAIPNETTITAAGLVAKNTPLVRSDSLTVQSLWNFGLSLIQALDAWDDCYLISGYLMRAYEGVPSFTVDELNFGDSLTPVYVEEVLTQIENTRMVFGQTVSASLNIYQDPSTNAVISQPVTTVSSTLTYGLERDLPPILSLRSDLPTVEENVIASRLQMSSGLTQITPVISSSATEGYPIHCASEVVISMSLYGCDPHAVGSPNNAVSLRSVFGVSTGRTSDTMYTSLPMYLWLTQFDWHPILYMLFMDSDTPNSGAQIIPIGDLHNVTVLDRAQLKELNRICLFSEFGSFTSNP